MPRSYPMDGVSPGTFRPFSDEDLTMFACVLEGLRHVFPYAELETYKTTWGDWVVNFLARKDGDVLLQATRKPGGSWVWLSVQSLDEQDMLIPFVSFLRGILSFR